MFPHRTPPFVWDFHISYWHTAAGLSHTLSKQVCLTVWRITSFIFDFYANFRDTFSCNFICWQAIIVEPESLSLTVIVLSVFTSVHGVIQKKLRFRKGSMCAVFGLPKNTWTQTELLRTRSQSQLVSAWWVEHAHMAWVQVCSTEMGVSNGSSALSLCTPVGGWDYPTCIWAGDPPVHFTSSQKVNKLTSLKIHKLQLWHRHTPTHLMTCIIAHASKIAHILSANWWNKETGWT